MSIASGVRKYKTPQVNKLTSRSENAIWFEIEIWFEVSLAVTTVVKFMSTITNGVIAAKLELCPTARTGREKIDLSAVTTTVFTIDTWS